MDGLQSGLDRRPPPSPSQDLFEQFPDGVVILIHHPLFEGDDGVVRDMDSFRADLGAALGDVAQPDARLVLEVFHPGGCVQGVHLQSGYSHEEPGAGELRC